MTYEGFKNVVIGNNELSNHTFSVPKDSENFKAGFLNWKLILSLGVTNEK